MTEAQPAKTDRSADDSTAASPAAPSTAASSAAASASAATTGRPRRRRWLSLMVGLLILAVAAWVGRDWLAKLPNALARRALATGAFEPAAWWLDVARRMSPRNAEAEFLRARCAAEQEDWDAAEAHLQRAGQWGWPSHQVGYQRWLVQARSGRTREAERDLPYFAADPNADPREMYSAFAQGCLRSRRAFPHANGMLGAWSSAFTQDPEPHYWKSRLSADVQDWKATEQSLRRALELDPLHGPASLALGQLLLSRQQFRESLEFLERATRHAPQRRTATLEQARCLRQLGQVDAARKLLEWLSHQYSGDVEVTVELARIDLDQNRPMEAAQRVAGPLDQFPNHPEANQVLAQALQATGKSDESQRPMQLATRGLAQRNRIGPLTWKVIQQPDDLRTRFEIGRIQLLYGSETEAMYWFDSVLDLRVDDPATQELLTNYFAQRASRSGQEPPMVRRVRTRLQAGGAVQSSIQ